MLGGLDDVFGLLVFVEARFILSATRHHITSLIRHHPPPPPSSFVPLSPAVIPNLLYVTPAVMPSPPPFARAVAV